MKVVMTGWRPGLKKVSLYGLLRVRLNVSLPVAKKYGDDLLDGEVIELQIDPGSASDFAKELDALGVICHIEPEE